MGVGPDDDSQIKKLRFVVIKSGKPLCILEQRCEMFKQDKCKSRM